MSASRPAGRVPVRDDLAEVEPYGAPQLDVPVRLNTNETPFRPPDAYFTELARRVASLDLHRYPDRRAQALRAALAERHGLGWERVWVANGSNEVLLQLFQAYGGPGRVVLFAQPGYSAHPLIARVAATDSVFVDLDDDLRLSADEASAAVERHTPAIACFASPNNPTGIALDLDVVRAVHSATSGLVVLDEAYVEFGLARGGATTGADLLDELDRLVVCRTFSKAWRLAGVRLGYLLAHDWVVDDLRRVRLPYHLDALTQAAGLVALEQADAITAHVAVLAAERDRVAAGLSALGVEQWPSDANFILFRVGDPRATFDGLLARRVLVRDFSTQPRLAGCLRVSIGTPVENDIFLSALADVLHGGGHPRTPGRQVAA